jgi:hypothetical protein
MRFLVAVASTAPALIAPAAARAQWTSPQDLNASGSAARTSASTPQR